MKISRPKLAYAHDEDDDAADDEGKDQRLHFGVHRPFPGAGKYPAQPQDGAAKPESAKDEDGIDDEADGDIGGRGQSADLPRQAGHDVTAFKSRIGAQAKSA